MKFYFAKLRFKRSTHYFAAESMDKIIKFIKRSKKFKWARLKRLRRLSEEEIVDIERFSLNSVINVLKAYKNKCVMFNTSGFPSIILQ
ncbi:MAG: hypothetical protein ABIG10_01160 [bacterium]